MLTDKDGDEPRHFHWGDPWHYALSRMVVAAAPTGLRPIDGPFGDFSDPDGFLAAAQARRRARLRGQVGDPPLARSRSPTRCSRRRRRRSTKAERILEAMKQAAKEGKGAVSLDGRLIDIASIRQAEQLVAKADMLGKPA